MVERREANPDECGPDITRYAQAAGREVVLIVEQELDGDRVAMFWCGERRAIWLPALCKTVWADGDLDVFREWQDRMEPIG